MTRPIARSRRLCLSSLLAFCVVSAWAGPGAGELTLDRAAVRELIALALPEPLEVKLPGLGTVRLALDPPRSVSFRDGGVETSLPVRLEGLERTVELAVRFVPGVEPLSGTVRLEAESVVPTFPLPIEIDLAAWVGSVDLPRRIDWKLQLESGGEAQVTCFVQGVAVEETRLRVDLGLVAR